jgi:hypothetical protein
MTNGHEDLTRDVTSHAYTNIKHGHPLKKGVGGGYILKTLVTIYILKP